MARRGCGALGREAGLASASCASGGGVKREGRRASRGCVRGAGRGAGARVAGSLRAVRRPPAFVRRRRGEPVREAKEAGRGGAWEDGHLGSA